VDKGKVLQMRMPALFGAKNFGLFKIYCVSAQSRKKGVEPMRTRREAGRGHFFAIFVLTSFMKDP